MKNILNAKNEDIQDMFKYLLEETTLVKFLIQNGPKVTINLNLSAGKETIDMDT